MGNFALWFILLVFTGCRTTNKFNSSYGEKNGQRYSFEEEDPDREYKKHSISRAVSNKCPKAADFVKYINDPNLVPKQCGEYNKDVMEQISILPQGGGYNINGTATNRAIRMGSSQLTQGVGRTSFCAGATYTVAMGVFNKHKAFEGMSEEQQKNFHFGNADNVGYWGAWKNDFGGVADANRMVQFGKDVPLNEACPGDMMKFSRTRRRGGHSVVFLGRDNGMIYYWSSNKSTAGYGVTCEAESNLVKTGQYAPGIVRITNPKNIRNVEKFTGVNYVNYYMQKQNIPSNMPSVFPSFKGLFVHDTHTPPPGVGRKPIWGPGGT